MGSGLSDEGGRMATGEGIDDQYLVDNTHYLTISVDGGIATILDHPRTCLTFLGCPYRKAITEVADSFDKSDEGRWRIMEIDSEGLPALEKVDG